MDEGEIPVVDGEHDGGDGVAGQDAHLVAGEFGTERLLAVGGHGCSSTLGGWRHAQHRWVETGR